MTDLSLVLDDELWEEETPSWEGVATTVSSSSCSIFLAKVAHSLVNKKQIAKAKRKQEKGKAN